MWPLECVIFIVRCTHISLALFFCFEIHCLWDPLPPSVGHTCYFGINENITMRYGDEVAKLSANEYSCSYDDDKMWSKKEWRKKNPKIWIIMRNMWQRCECGEWNNIIFMISSCGWQNVDCTFGLIAYSPFYSNLIQNFDPLFWIRFFRTSIALVFSFLLSSRLAYGEFVEFRFLFSRSTGRARLRVMRSMKICIREIESKTFF